MPEPSKIWDVAVIGAGAAGLMSAITAKRRGAEVILLDGKSRIGAKILMSGGTRCNLTNQNVTEKDFESEHKNALRAVLKAFSSEHAVEFFQNLGIQAVLEEGGKYFPSTHSGRAVLEAFLKEVNRLGISLETSRKVGSLEYQNGRFLICGEDFSYYSRALVLTTGGLSFPATGSDGAGYGMAKHFGHSLVPTTPSLTPLLTEDPDWKSLSGLSLPVSLSLWTDGKKKIAFEGPLLFTHFGFSGPSALNISRHWIRLRNADLFADFLPELSEERLRDKLLLQAGRHPGRRLKNILTEDLPERFVEVFLAKQKIPTALTLNQLKRPDREGLLRRLFHFPLRPSGFKGYEKAEVTAGGIPLSEVDKNTMQSKFQPGLFFAGEILDADGRIGGFNFQWAWSSGALAGRAAADLIRTLDVK